VSELTKLVAVLDWHINKKINRDAVVFGNATKKANEGVFVASRVIDDEVIKIAKILDKRLAEQEAIVKKQCQAMESLAEQIKRVLKV
jgi:signal transduction protein with GAF and PtsI domain